jgi:hypothetical protein
VAYFRPVIPKTSVRRIRADRHDGAHISIPVIGFPRVIEAQETLAVEEE